MCRVLPESLGVARPDVMSAIGQRSHMKLVELVNEATDCSVSVVAVSVRFSPRQARVCRCFPRT